MKKSSSKVMVSILSAILMAVLLVALFESAANSPLMQYNLLQARRAYANYTSDDYQIIRDYSPQTNNQATDDDEASLTVREVVLTAYISPALPDSVDSFIWREFSRLSESFDLDIHPFSSNDDFRREANEVRNAVRNGFGVILINPSCPERIVPAIREAYESGLVIGTLINDLVPEAHDYRHFFIPFVGNVSELLTLPESAEEFSVQSDLSRMVLSMLRSTRSVLDLGYVNPNLVIGQLF